jgi:hypothetical protein
VPDSDVLTAADIARLAGVTRATVSNWRRRHADFPAPVGGTSASPAYSRGDVERWLTGRGAFPDLPLDDQLWRSIRAVADDDTLAASLPDAVEYMTGGTDVLRVRTGTSKTAAMLALIEVLNESAQEHGRRSVLDALIHRYADSSGAQAGATPEPVAELMTALAAPRSGDTVLDPAVGTGNLLFSTRKYRVSRLFGQDLKITTALLAARRYGPDADEPGGDDIETVLRQGDSLRNDQFADLLADVVLCHPPFGVQDWGLDELAEDSRWQYGTPPRPEGELAWVQHSLAHLREGGRAVVLMPPAAASRPSGRRIRAELVRHGALRAVVSLPPGAVEPRHIPVHIWVLGHPDSQGSPDPHVLLMDAGYLGASWPSSIAEIAAIWATVHEKPGFWRNVPAVDLLDDSVDLTPARHVGAAIQAWSPDQTTAELRAVRSGMREAVGKLSSSPIYDDWEFREQDPRWRMATILELGHWKSAVFHRASTTAPLDQEADAGQWKSKGHPVLRTLDVESGGPPSGVAPDGPIPPGWVIIQQGDVIVPAALGNRARTRVAGLDDDGAILGRGLHLIRPDPERLDSWFVSGFLSSPASVHQASTGTTGTRIDVRRLAVPVIPLDQQRRYGAEFRELHELELASRALAALTARLSQLLGDNLVTGRLKPYTQPPQTVHDSTHDPGGDEKD